MATPLQEFTQYFVNAFNNQQLVKLTLGNKHNKASLLNNVFIKPVLVKNTAMLCFVYRHTTKDITKNYNLAEASSQLQQLLQDTFLNADLFTSTSNWHLTTLNNKARLKSSQAVQTGKAISYQHDKEKKRMIAAHNNIYLQLLGVVTPDGQVKKDMQDKYRQINKYVEIIDGIIKDVNWGDAFTVADMGSGKGYLTFVLYDYLQHQLKKQALVKGVELRKDLVEKCNSIAAAAGFAHLHFEEGSIEAADIAGTDMLIALHACDTATDDAIYKGIQAGSKVIICAPCCHKQIRKQMAPTNALQLITQHGILLERQAEMVADTIRALLLEAHGYKTKIFEFIATEHTPKNILITAVKKQNPGSPATALQQVQALKDLFNIKQHYLEKLLKI
jgi:hypothetical protein